MLKRQINIQQTIQYVLVISFFLILALAPKGSVSIDLTKHIYYFRVGPSQDISVSSNLETGTAWCVIVAITTIIETVLLGIKGKISCAFGVILCLFRQIYPALLMVLKVCKLILNDDEVVVDLTIYTYMLFIIGIASFVNYLSIKKKMKVLQKVKNEQQETEQPT